MSFAIRHPICLSKCVRNYRQFQKHALAPTLGAIVLFTAGKYRSETRGCARQLTWQLAENNPAREESNHVIMHTHVAWVKIKPYSSLAASLLSCLSPSQDMAAVQPGSQEKRCHGFHGRSQIRAVWRLGARLLHRSRNSASAFPQIISSVLMPGVWNFVGWERRC